MTDEAKKMTEALQEIATEASLAVSAASAARLQAQHALTASEAVVALTRMQIKRLEFLNETEGVEVIGGLTLDRGQSFNRFRQFKSVAHLEKTHATAAEAGEIWNWVRVARKDVTGVVLPYTERL